METHTFFLQLLVILITARFLAEVAARIQVPRVIGELFAGILLGPSILGWLEPNLVIKLLAEIGVLFLLFEVGLKTNVMHLVESGSTSLKVALVGFLMPFILGFALSYSVFSLSLLASLFIGGTLTATSIGVTIRVLTDLGRQDSYEGRVVLGAAVLDDIMGVVLLALLYEFSTRGGISIVNTGRVILFISIFFVLAPLAAKCLSILIRHFQNSSEIPGLVTTTIVSLVLFFAWLAHAMGSPEILGGFAAGLALSRRFILPLGAMLSSENPDFSNQIQQNMKPIVHLFTPVFFVMVGLSINLKEVDWSSLFIWVFFLAQFFLALFGKLIGGWMAPGSWPQRWVIGTAMIPRGEVGLVFSELGHISGVINKEVHAGITLVIVATTLMAPLIMKSLYNRFEIES